MHFIVTRGHLRLRDKDGGHTVRSAAAETLGSCCRKPHGSVFYRTGVIAERSFTLQEIWLSIFNHFLPCDLDIEPTTFIYDLIRSLWRYIVQK